MTSEIREGHELTAKVFGSAAAAAVGIKSYFKVFGKY